MSSHLHCCQAHSTFHTVGGMLMHHLVRQIVYFLFLLVFPGLGDQLQQRRMAAASLFRRLLRMLCHDTAPDVSLRTGHDGCLEGRPAWGTDLSCPLGIPGRKCCHEERGLLPWLHKAHRCVDCSAIPLPQLLTLLLRSLLLGRVAVSSNPDEHLRVQPCCS